MNKVFLLIGGNLGDREKYLDEAVKCISKLMKKVVKTSSVYETEAWGKTDQPSFLNQVLLVETNQAALEVLNSMLKIELEMGRQRTEKYGPRVIDIDVLFFNDEVIKHENLTIPHPAIAERRFVLTPLAEIAPDLIHPVSQKTVQQMLEVCPDKLAVNKIAQIDNFL